MTEIPEHLLKRAQAAREKAAGEAAQPAAEADSPAEADSRIPAHLLERSKAARTKAAGDEPESGGGVAVADKVAAAVATPAAGG
ncbi:MAG: menaquinol-cytochrome c reductase cytochrome b subunit, partial [Ilumatobacteraceae bacterium]